MKPKLALARPSAATSKAATKLEEGEARLVVNLPEALHRKVKLRAVERGITIREYVLGLLDADGLS
jgi:predicted DNA binding CopG/RHH family protein